MTITRRPYLNEADMPRILELVSKMPLSCRHVIDLPWRLSSPTINEGHNAIFWENTDGQIIGFAAWQYYWAALDFFILPGPEMHTLETDLFTWAEEHFRERDIERGQPLPYWIEFRDDDQERRQLVEAHGFLLDEHDCYVLLQHSLTNLFSVPLLPDGFQLRALAGEHETPTYAELHCAAFESTSMTPEWRARTLRTPHYQPELDLVVSAPDGSLAAFCVGWFEPSRRAAQIEPIGVHPHFQQLGLGRILLLEMLHRFKEHGANTALVETYTESITARRAYESVGFQQTHTIRRKGKWANLPTRAETKDP